MKKMYVQLGALLFKLARPLLRLYFKGSTGRRSRVVILNEQDEILLVKGWFSRQWWELPGGGINRGEHSADAALREVHEETGIVADKNKLTFIREFTHTDTATPYRVVLFVLNTTKADVQLPRFRGLEIVDKQWFSVKNLPKNISPLVSSGLNDSLRVEK